MAKVVEVATKAYDDQKPGTSGLRKKVKHFQQENYVENFVQATFDALASAPELGGIPEVLALGGDGRYLSEPTCQTIIRMAAANGVKQLVVGQHTLMSTPAVSAVIRTHSSKPGGAFILTASHNPGGPENDFGMKYNMANGGPAPEKVTNLIYEKSKSITQYRTVQGVNDFNLGVLGASQVTDACTVEVIDSVSLYAHMMATIFDLESIKRLVGRKDFTLIFDGMNGVAGPYARRVLGDILGADPAQLCNSDPLPDFGGGHPDPNLTYAHDLVVAMGLNASESFETSKLMQGKTVFNVDGKPRIPSFGAACDGDADRNMILANECYVSPSDSVAIIAANASAIPYFRAAGGVKALARSMPTSGALDLVAKGLGVPVFEVPTGWKFFGNLMDSKALYGQTDYTPLICGEESFGTGSSHVREKDGLWAVLAWLNLLAARNADTPEGSLVTVAQIQQEHWLKYGRNYYSRYDYEEVASEGANQLMDAMRNIDAASLPELEVGGQQTKVAKVDDFSYTDPVDGSVSQRQGIRVIFEDGSRFVLRLSGTGSVGATIRLYLEQYVSPAEAKAMADRGNGSMPATADALAALTAYAIRTARVKEFTGRDKPTVIT